MSPQNRESGEPTVSDMTGGSVDVLVVGAGPTGLALAAQLGPLQLLAPQRRSAETLASDG